MCDEPSNDYGLPPRFWAKVDRRGPDDCWLWTGHLNDGYGRLKVNGRGVYAYRWLYERAVGPVPEGLVLDHRVCDNRACVNPAHLVVTTNRENVLRGNGAAARHARQTHCKRGHPLSGEGSDVRIEPWGGRRCRICVRLLWAAKS